MRKNILTNIDSYKASHKYQYPPGAQYVTSYIEARGIAKILGLPDDLEIVHVGPQMFIKEYLTEGFTAEDIDEAEDLIPEHIPGLKFPREDWEIILREYGGRPPIEIRGLPEGTLVKPGIPQIVVRNTDPRFPWLTSYFETAILRAVWYPSTVATVSREIKKLIARNFLVTDTKEVVEAQLPFKLHDFGARGATSNESAGIGGVGHLVNFMGTDTLEAIRYARYFYGEKMAGYSIPASEHSTITSWGRKREKDAYENMIVQFSKPGSIFACVSDSYNIYDACDFIWGKQLKELIVSSGGTLVVRPDSGKPVDVVMSVLNTLGNRFGYDLNTKGFKVLRNVRVIQGDGINYNSIFQILYAMITAGWSIQNIAFGMGGALLQRLDRDSLKYAMKANAITIDGVEHEVYKDPVDDPGKASKRGTFDVVRRNGVLEVLPTQNYQQDEMRPIWKVEAGIEPKTIFTTLQKIRENAKVPLD